MLVKSFIVTFLLLFIFLTDSSTSLRSARNDNGQHAHYCVPLGMTMDSTLIACHAERSRDICQNEAVRLMFAPV